MASFTNTGATTLSVNGGATKSILSLSSSGLQALGANTIVAGQVTEVVYDGTQFELLSAQNAFSAFPHFANTSAVQAITSTTLYPSIIRDNYAVSGDGGTAWYNLTVGGRARAQIMAHKFRQLPVAMSRTFPNSRRRQTFGARRATA